MAACTLPSHYQQLGGGIRIRCRMNYITMGQWVRFMTNTRIVVRIMITIRIVIKGFNLTGV